ncbi:MAG: bifunctional indole-3-glycerol-phosphate synthase TrpC/phosphoribosylanthranilate isomerase TrpF [Gammaproteobacteria bacterium]|nr:bifunctional indole-3-glycerol-phosphate synthase TrpC/phosphoribosylanthranilate isomerase TrpF [Gammaproteobacteria bacterium]
MALERILAAKRRRLEAAPVPEYSPEPYCGPGLADALARPGPSFILECKAASPSAGTLMTDYDPAALAGQYAGVADAVSVLTEPEFFGGDISHLGRVGERADVPVLRKDFILGPVEVREARAHGAAAVLLMLSVLDDGDWRLCFEAAQALGMDALTEVHDEAELRRAIDFDAPIIGINNRNLETLEVDLAVTERLASQIPGDRWVVCESGISERADVLRLAPHVDAFLIGTRLSRGGRPAHTARELAFGRFKVCGLARAEDALAAWESGAVMGGMIFAPDSQRCIDLATARRLKLAAPLDWVGVFRDQPVASVAQHARELTLAVVQLHGGESDGYVRDLRGRLPEGCAIWKAVPARLPFSSAEGLGVDRLLLDTGRNGRLGGSGVPFDPVALSGADLSGCVLAGGIAPHNATSAASFQPWALDINSGVEAAPGIKSSALLKQVSNALRTLPGKRSHPHE